MKKNQHYLPQLRAAVCGAKFLLRNSCNNLLRSAVPAGNNIYPLRKGHCPHIGNTIDCADKSPVDVVDLFCRHPHCRPSKPRPKGRFHFKCAAPRIGDRHRDVHIYPIRRSASRSRSTLFLSGCCTGSTAGPNA